VTSIISETMLAIIPPKTAGDILILRTSSRTPWLVPLLAVGRVISVMVGDILMVRKLVHVRDSYDYSIEAYLGI
jgi:hypothetical protein